MQITRDTAEIKALKGTTTRGVPEVMMEMQELSELLATMTWEKYNQRLEKWQLLRRLKRMRIIGGM